MLLHASPTQTLFTRMCVLKWAKKDQSDSKRAQTKASDALDANSPFYQSLITTLIKDGERKKKASTKETITAYFPLKSHHFCVTK